ncbi:MAG: mechanosensitive ion channel family protein [Desulfuromonadales bacterium]|nr:mechanosensitive ion channel family protein [Desulfuromonadales bacterium]
MGYFTDQSIFGNTVEMYVMSLGVFVVGVLCVYLFKKVFVRRLRIWARSTVTQLDDILVVGIEKAAIPLAYFGAFYLSVQNLNVSVKVERALYFSTVIVLTYCFLKATTEFLKHLSKAYIKNEEGEDRARQIKGLTTFLNVVIWVLGLMFLLDNLGFKITSVVAGLGIGGIAIALAAQTVLGDLFNYFVIFFDRPFEVGDFLIIEDKKGTVEHIGIKTTRIRSLGGELLVFHNTDLTNSRIHNYKKMERRRVVFQVGVVYQTTPENLENLPLMMKEIIEKQEDATFDRAHFAGFGDFSLNFEMVYYVLGADYAHYMDIQQAINLTIFREFQQKGIEFAYPTQTLFMNRAAS